MTLGVRAERNEPLRGSFYVDGEWLPCDSFFDQVQLDVSFELTKASFEVLDDLSDGGRGCSAL